jgi:YHS domain-containing protein
MMRPAILCLVIAVSASAVEAPKSRTAREALQPFNLLIGSWRAAGIPEGTPDERQKGHWTETIDWEWQFKGDNAWLAVRFDKGKYFSKGELHFRPAEDTYELKVETADKQALTFSGPLKEKQLTLERTDEGKKETQRLIFSLLHSNRIVYRYEVKPEGKTFYNKVYQVGATKEGVPFANVGVPERECVVSGGTGTITVTYNGKTYYVCCTGCRDEFRENPEKYIKEYEKRRAERAKQADQ